MIIDDFLRYMETERVASPATVATYREVLADFRDSGFGCYSRLAGLADGKRAESLLRLQAAQCREVDV